MRLIIFHLITIIVCLSLIVSTSSAKDDENCEELKAKEATFKCDDSTDFDEYKKCVKERKEIRQKRQIICPLTGQPIDQVISPTIQRAGSVVAPIIEQDIVAPIPVQRPFIYESVQSSASDPVQPIVEQQVVPPIFVSNQVQAINPVAPQVIYEAPVASGSQTEAQYILAAAPVRPVPAPGLVPADPINREYEIIGQNGSYKHSQVYPSPRNITTVIKLHNYINNTNVINMPTHINSTNINNITIYTNSSEENRYGLGYTDNGPCCFAVQPKRCHGGSYGVRCHHRRHKTCGNQCTSRIIHVKSQNRCGHESCGVNVDYIPQPSPKCVYTDSWPYVNCGYRRRDACDGCYDHYSSGYENYQASYSQCRGCYDDGFEYGQMYRRGPVLRPFYQAEPPCYITGACASTGYGYGSGYGYRSYPPPNAPEFYDEEFESGEEGNGNNTETVESDWGVQITKCRVLGENGTAEIRNCTISENPYASAPINPPYYAPQPLYPSPPMYAPYYQPIYYPPPPPPSYYPPPYPRHHSNRKHNRYIPPRPIPANFQEDEAEEFESMNKSY